MLPLTVGYFSLRINCAALDCRIFQFENFARTKKRVLARELEGGAMVGEKERGDVCD